MHSIEKPSGVSPWSFIELDGVSHEDPHVIENDQRKNLFLKTNNICLLRFTDDELFRDYESVLKRIGVAIDNVQTPPTPSFQEGVLKSCIEAGENDFAKGDFSSWGDFAKILVKS